MNIHQSNTELQDDGLITPSIGPWGEKKYLLVYNYAQIFANSMKHKWDCRVYIDLFAGAGRSRIEGASRVVLASPLLALQIIDKFDLYIFCEKESAKLEALRQRVRRDYSDATVEFIAGDSNLKTDDILSKIPQANKGFKVLAFCFADPYKLKNLRFSTIENLSKRFVDFLILIPSGMDANRNLEAHYLKPENTTIDEFVGTSDWRYEWQKTSSKQSFDIFLTDYYGQKMRKLGYYYLGIDSTQLIRSSEKNLPLYRLALFSRSELGERFWKETRKYSDPQMNLFN
jgi:three-Cys-motif partner protein